MSRLVILKLGGSLLTAGDRRPRVRKEILDRIARELRAHPPLILVHGAGSFGHGPVERGEPPWRVHRSVLALDREVCDGLARAGLAPVPVDPFSAGGLAGLAGPVRRVLAAGSLPVLYGALVPSRGGFQVLSGDRIVSRLARSLGARRVGMATDVEGILKEGRPLPVLRRGERVDFFPVEGDVTGAMEGKVRELRGLARRGVAAFVFSGERPGNVRRFLAGKPAGTRVL